MTRTTIATLFIGSTIAFVVGAVIATVTTVTAVANGAIEIGGPQIVALHGGPIGAAIAAYAVASLFGVGGSIALFASWLGAVLNTWRLDDKTWFTGILGAGLVGLAWIATAGYLAMGPDRGSAVRSQGAGTTAA
jgi:hypothetical protein